MRLYVIAMHSEAKDIIKKFTKIEDEIIDLYKNENIMVAITNIGKVNASLALSHLLTKYNDINEVINIGFAGAYGDFYIGEKVLVNETKYHDFDLTIFNYKLGEVPNIKIPLVCDVKYLRHFYDLKRANLYTGDSFQTKKLDESYLADMEGAALSHVCHIYNKDFISIKVVSDLIEKSDIKDYVNFEEIGSKNIYNLFKLVESRLI